MIRITWPHRFEMISTTWQDESEKRPSFAEIVQILQRYRREASLTHGDEENEYVDVFTK